MLHRAAEYYGGVLLLCFAIGHLVFVWTQDVWSDIDEIAHYDYIHRLTHGETPLPTEAITDYTADITREYFSFKSLPKYDGTKETMLIAGMSYEAYQPHLYYAIMALPNLLLEDTAPPRRIRFLRSFNVLFYLAAALLLWRAWIELAELVGLPRVYGVMLAALMLSVAAPSRYHLSNDQLLPLLGNLTLLLTVRLWRSERLAFIGWSALSIALLGLTKSTGLLVAVPWAVATLAFLRSRGAIGWSCAAYLSPLLLIPTYYVASWIVTGHDSASRTAEALHYFDLWVRSAGPPLQVVETLFQSSVGLEPYLPTGKAFALGCAAVMGINAGLSLYRSVWDRQRSALPLLLATCTSMLIVGIVLLLDRTLFGVQWEHFRHYGSCVGLWLVALTCTPLLLRSRWLGLTAEAVALTALTLLAVARLYYHL